MYLCYSLYSYHTKYIDSTLSLFAIAEVPGEAYGAAEGGDAAEEALPQTTATDASNSAGEPDGTPTQEAEALQVPQEVAAVHETVGEEEPMEMRIIKTEPQ